MNTVLDQKVLRFSLSSELVDQISTLARFWGRENWTILGDNGSLNRFKGIQYQLKDVHRRQKLTTNSQFREKNILSMVSEGSFLRDLITKSKVLSIFNSF